MKLLTLLLLCCGYQVVCRTIRPWVTMLSLGSRDSAKLNVPQGEVNKIDTGLYSRQLFVYGTDAQQLLSSASALVVGESPLVSEVVKNLALTGVGKLTVPAFDFKTRGTPALIGNDSSASYAKSLNSLIDVREYTNFNEALNNGDFTTAVVLDKSLEDLKTIDKHCRSRNIRLVSACTYNGCGLIFNDFNTDFEVRDVDGEPPRKV